MKHLTQDEIKKLLREVPNERQRLMFKVAFLHGLRVSELITLTRENIRDGYVTVQRLKGSNKTTQPFMVHPDPEISEAEGLAALFGTLKAGEILFPMSRGGVYRLMQRAGTRAGIPVHKLHPHALKHSCAMAVVNKIGIQELRTYLGHKSLNSTGAYLKESDETASRAFAGAF
jgi:integrase/recombinase XerD